MKCPKCGRMMKEGKLYCEHCGEEIKIVPDFEPEIENSIHINLSHIATEITSPFEEKEAVENEDGKEKSADRKMKRRLSTKKKLFASVAVLLAGLVSVFLVLQLFFWFHPGVQYDRAQKAMERLQYEKAAAYFERALELSPADISCLAGLSRCYLELGKEEEAEALCLEILSMDPSNAEAYGRLIALYGQREQYESIHRLLLDCPDNDIKNQYSDYLAEKPEAEAKGGTYQKVMNIRLIANSTGVIYYTLDGSDPDENSDIYTNPIPLEAGPYILKAFFVNQYGVKSDMTVEEYYIDVVLPKAPDVQPKSGVYARPHLLEMEIPEDYSVYYTLDGSDPDSNSTLYDGELWMPVGHTLLRFVTVSPSGVCSEVCERQYTLDLHPLLSMEAASNQLMLTLKNAGVISDLQGGVTSKEGRNIYTYKHTMTINGHNYYFYREYYEESAGTSNATGRDYVVNYMSGECYEAVQQEDHTFRLLRIEAQEAETGENGEES